MQYKIYGTCITGDCITDRSDKSVGCRISEPITSRHSLAPAGQGRSNHCTVLRPENTSREPAGYVLTPRQEGHVGHSAGSSGPLSSPHRAGQRRRLAESRRAASSLLIWSGTSVTGSGDGGLTLESGPVQDGAGSSGRLSSPRRPEEKTSRKPEGRVLTPHQERCVGSQAQVTEARC